MKINKLDQKQEYSKHFMPNNSLIEHKLNEFQNKLLKQLGQIQSKLKEDQCNIQKNQIEPLTNKLNALQLAHAQKIQTCTESIEDLNQLTESIKDLSKQYDCYGTQANILSQTIGHFLLDTDKKPIEFKINIINNTIEALSPNFSNSAILPVIKSLHDEFLNIKHEYEEISDRNRLLHLFDDKTSALPPEQKNAVDIITNKMLSCTTNKGIKDILTIAYSTEI